MGVMKYTAMLAAMVAALSAGFTLGSASRNDMVDDLIRQNTERSRLIEKLFHVDSLNRSTIKTWQDNATNAFALYRNCEASK